MPLKDTEIKNAKPRDKQFKLADGAGLYVLIHPNGSKYWRLKYRIGGKEKVLAIGIYPEVSLAKARELSILAKAKIKEGIDPIEHKRQAKQQVQGLNSLAVIANEWMEVKRPTWSEKHYIKIKGVLTNHIYPQIGKADIKTITGKQILDLAKKVESEGLKAVPENVLTTLSQVFTYAIFTSRAESNPCIGLRAYLEHQIEEHHRHISVAELEDLLQAIEAYKGMPATKIACKLFMLVFLRSNELRFGRWEDIDWNTKLWTIPSMQMKGRKVAKESGKLTHIVPLAEQTIELLKELYTHTGHGKYMFPSTKRNGLVMSDGTINKMMKLIGFHDKQTTHGFRGLASTVLNERQAFPSDVIEAQLSHAGKDKVKRAYDHSTLLEPRRELMQYWADYLTEHGLKTVTLR